MTSITEWIDAAQKRCDAATEGPWVAVEGATPGMFWVELRHRATICDFPREQGAQEDAEFIAAARTDLPAALAALRAVLGEHREVPDSGRDYGECETCGTPFPCGAVRAIAAALGVAP